MTKRVVAAVLCAITALALLPAVSLAEDPTDGLQQAINTANGSLTLGKTYQGAGVASVSITSDLILDLSEFAINDITLNIGNDTAAPVVVIKAGGNNGQVNGSLNAININNGSLAVESGTIIGDRLSGIGVNITDGSVTIRGGTIKGHTAINYQGGSLTFDCAGEAASIESAFVSLRVAPGKSVTVADATRVKVGSDEKTAAQLIGDIADTITLDIRPAAPSITAPAALTEPMSNTGAYSGEFILAGDPLPIVDKIKVTDKNGVSIQDTYVSAAGYIFSWDASTKKVKVLTGLLDAGDYTVTLTDTTGLVSCNWQVTITKFVVIVTTDRPAATPNCYVIDPGDSITLTATPTDMIQGGYIWWDVYNLGDTSSQTRSANPLTYTPAQNVMCIPYVMRDNLAIPRSNVALDSIKVFYRITVTQGANSRWLRDNADGLRFVTTGKESDFFGIYIDSIANEIQRNFSREKYTISSDPVSGGMVLTLLPELLAPLPDGPHTLTFQYYDCAYTVNTVFYVGADAPGGPDIPKTGDSTPLALLCGLVLLAGAGLAVSAAVRKRERAK